jgi:hypothetical protein
MMVLKGSYFDVDPDKNPNFYNWNMVCHTNLPSLSFSIFLVIHLVFKLWALVDDHVLYIMTAQIMKSIQGTFREHSGNIQGTFREHSGNIQGTFREHSGNIQGTFRGN